MRIVCLLFSITPSEVTRYPVRPGTLLEGEVRVPECIVVFFESVRPLEIPTVALYTTVPVPGYVNNSTANCTYYRHIGRV